MMAEKPLRIAYVSTYPPVHCGVGEYTRLLTIAIRNTSTAEVVVLAEEGVGRDFEDLEAGARVIPAFKRSDASSAERILDALSLVGGVDVLHVQHEYGIIPWTSRLLETLDIARRERLARSIVVTLHTVYRGSTLEGAEEFQRGALNTADAVIVHSPVQEFELHAEAGGYPTNLYRIPHGTTVNPYLGKPRRILAAQLGIPLSLLKRRLIAFPGFIRPDKGLDTLAGALRILGRDAPALVLGGEPVGGGLEAFEGLEEVHVIPRYLSASEIMMLAAISDAVVLPYRDPPGKYAVSGVLHLSIGSLKPVIGSSVPRLYELYTLTPRLVFRAGDPGDLAAKLRETLDAAGYDNMVTYASPLYSYAVRTSWPRIARRHLALYERILGEASASRSSS